MLEDSRSLGQFEEARLDVSCAWHRTNIQRVDYLPASESLGVRLCVVACAARDPLVDHKTGKRVSALKQNAAAIFVATTMMPLRLKSYSIFALNPP